MPDSYESGLFLCRRKKTRRTDFSEQTSIPFLKCGVVVEQRLIVVLLGCGIFAFQLGDVFVHNAIYLNT